MTMAGKIEGGVSDVAIPVEASSHIAQVQGISTTGRVYYTINLTRVISSLGCLAGIEMTTSELEFHLVYVE